MEKRDVKARAADTPMLAMPPIALTPVTVSRSTIPEFFHIPAANVCATGASKTESSAFNTPSF